MTDKRRDRDGRDEGIGRRRWRSRGRNHKRDNCSTLFLLHFIPFIFFPLHVMFVIEFASKIFLEAETSDKKRR